MKLITMKIQRTLNVLTSAQDAVLWENLEPPLNSLHFVTKEPDFIVVFSNSSFIFIPVLHFFLPPHLTLAFSINKTPPSGDKNQCCVNTK